MASVLMYTTQACPYCQMATRLLEQKGVAVEKVRVDTEPARRQEMIQRAHGAKTVPRRR